MEEENQNQPMPGQVPQVPNPQPVIPSGPLEPAEVKIDAPMATPGVQKPKGKFSLVRLLITILIVLLVAGAAGGAVWYLMNQKIKDQKKSYEEQIQTLQSTKNSIQQSLDEVNKKSQTGIDTNKQEMYQISSFADPTWETTTYNYEVKKATIVPIIADMGNFRDNYKDKEWVAVEILITDKRTSGTRQNVMISNDIRLVSDGQKIPPLDDSNSRNSLSPLESRTIYVFFPVQSGSKSFSLWLGNLDSPTVNEINFSQGTKLTGYYLMNEGYQETYEE